MSQLKSSPIMKSPDLSLRSSDVAGRRKNQGSKDEVATVLKPVEHGTDMKEKMDLLQEILREKSKDYKDEDDKFLKSNLKKEIMGLYARLLDLQNEYFQIRGLIS